MNEYQTERTDLRDRPPVYAKGFAAANDGNITSGSTNANSSARRRWCPRAS